MKNLFTYEYADAMSETVVYYYSAILLVDIGRLKAGSVYDIAFHIKNSTLKFWENDGEDLVAVFDVSFKIGYELDEKEN
jgi:hypothetical protein